jgi:hypothetical protein
VPARSAGRHQHLCCRARPCRQTRRDFGSQFIAAEVKVQCALERSGCS